MFDSSFVHGGKFTLFFFLYGVASCSYLHSIKFSFPSALYIPELIIRYEEPFMSASFGAVGDGGMQVGQESNQVRKPRIPHKFLGQTC
jgi:hypothetical protein